MPEKQKYQRLFAAGEADKKPTLVCTGYVFKIGEGHLSASEKYNVNPIEIQPYGGGRPVTLQFLSRPEWFALGKDGKPTFRPAAFKTMEGGKGMSFVYKKMISNPDKLAAIPGLAGTEDRLARLEQAMVESEGLDGDESAQILQGIFENILVAGDGEDAVEIGYTLVQASEKTDEVNEEGKAIYLAKKGYDLKEFWQVSDREKKRFRGIAEQSAARQKAKGESVSFKVCFDDGLTAPF